MSGISKICKIYGSIEAEDSDGNKKTWVYDYANDKPRLKGEMTQEEIAKSEKTKWTGRHIK